MLNQATTYLRAIVMYKQHRLHISAWEHSLMKSCFMCFIVCQKTSPRRQQHKNCKQEKKKKIISYIYWLIFRYARNWRYHKELGLWLTKETDENGRPVQSFRRTSPNGLDRGVYVFFDPTTWQKVKREWTLSWDALEERSQPSQQQQGPSNPSSSNSNRVIM